MISPCRVYCFLFKPKDFQPTELFCVGEDQNTSIPTLRSVTKRHVTRHVTPFFAEAAFGVVQTAPKIMRLRFPSNNKTIKHLRKE